MRRRIKKAVVTFLSLVPRGANRLPVLVKADGAEFQALTKANADASEILSVVYAPEFVDSQGDIADASVIQGMAHSFMQSGAKLDLRHNGQPISVEKAYVAETFIIQKDDARFSNWLDDGGKPVNCTGGWATVIKVADAQLRKDYLDGKWNGVSLFAPAAEFEMIKTNDPTEDQIRRIQASISEDTAMTPEQFAQFMEQNKKNHAEMMASIRPAGPSVPVVQPAAPAAPVAKAAIVFKGDPTDKAAVAKHAEMLRKEAAKAAVDWADPESVASYLATLPDKAPATPAPSNAPAPTAGDLAKAAEDDPVACGRRMAAIVNAQK